MKYVIPIVDTIISIYTVRRVLSFIYKGIDDAQLLTNRISVPIVNWVILSYFLIGNHCLALDTIPIFIGPDKFSCKHMWFKDFIVIKINQTGILIK